MIFRSSIAIAAAVVAALPSLAQGVATWGSHFNMGTFAVGTDQRASPGGGWLSLQCNPDKGRAWVYAEIAGKPPASKSRLTIEVALRTGKTVHAFATGADGSVETGAKARDFLVLWNDLKRGSSATVRFTDGKTWTTSLASAAKAFGPGGCV